MSDIAAMAPSLDTRNADARNPILPLEVRDVTLRLGETNVLDRISFNLRPVGCTVILGPNGAGKSLLLKLLHGLLHATSGQIDWAGHAPEDVTARQALVFQTPVLLRRSVAANIEFVLKARGKNPAECPAILDRAGLSHKARQPARLLSGGEAQRLALARALATDPEVLLLDEPTASLDPASVLAIERIVGDAKARGVRIVMVTHDIGQARRLADDVLFLCGGRIIEHSRAQDFFPTPNCAAARDYVAGNIVV